MCALTAPEVFDQDDAGTVVLLDSAPPLEQHLPAAQAVGLCPSGALTMEPENAAQAR